MQNGSFARKVKRKLAASSRRVLQKFTLCRTRNKDVVSKAMQCHVYETMEKKYRSILEAGVTPGEQQRSNKVWICWLQGFESAPDLVKACYQSVKQNLRGYEIIALDSANIGDYVQLPDYIEEKRERGALPMAQYSDLIRLAVLCKYGGLWIDATVLCTSADIMKVIDREPLFVFKSLQLSPRDKAPTVASNWCIAACSNHPILLLTQKLLYEYWRNERGLKDYFIFHIFFALAARKYAEEWNRMPLFNNISPHVLQFELGSEFSEERWSQILSFSSLHKLNRRMDYSDRPNSFYAHILRQYLN